MQKVKRENVFFEIFIKPIVEFRIKEKIPCPVGTFNDGPCDYAVWNEWIEEN